METNIIVGGLLAMLVGYLFYKKFWDMQSKGTVEQELHDVLTKDEHRVKGKFE